MSNKTPGVSLPELGRNSNILLAVLLSQFGAMLIWLVTEPESGFATYGAIALYCLWAVLITLFLLRLSNALIQRMSYLLGCVFILGIAVVSILSIELVLSFSGDREFDWPRFLRLSLFACLIAGLMIWWFRVLGLLKQRGSAEAESRVLALQNRIQPHFLFNSLNTISELVATKPEEAEEAIDALAKLFRVSLETKGQLHAISDELELCHRYLKLQKWRFGSKLVVEWSGLDIDSSQLWNVPKLVLQPVIENALTHGVAEDGSVCINIDIRETSTHLSFKIVNLVGKSSSKGHGIAISNIQERLFVLYDDQQYFSAKPDGDQFEVLMRIPKQTER